MKPTIDRISILITAYKNSELVERCVSSLKAAFDGKLPETVIVDDAAGDPEIKKIVEAYAEDGIKFVVMPQNGGFAGANNFGIQFCTKEFPVLVNSDIVFNEEPFTAMLEFMDSHPKAGIIQGTLIIKNGQEGVDGTLNGCGAFLTPFGTTTTPGWLAPADAPVAREARKCFAAYGAMFMIRREALKSTGRLFYDFFHTYYEEVDFCHRAWLSGWEVWYVPTPIADHAHGATMSKFYEREDILKKFYRNIRFSFATCFGLRGRFCIIPIFEIGCFLSSLIQLLHGKPMNWRAHAWSKKEIKKLRSKIKETRKAIQSTRKMSDSQLFKLIMRNYKLKDLIAFIKRYI
jgi:GT2 family glycosyltransferase